VSLPLRMDFLISVLLWLPWIAVGVFLVLFVRTPPRIRRDGPPLPDPPRVSIIVPARNEERNIQTLLDSLTALQYPSFEILVVDDESRDRTREIVLAAEPGRAESLRLLPGQPLPEGWLGKPWACFQGAREARGDLLLFTDADTRHSPELLSRAVGCLMAEDGQALTLVGRQVMRSFWERLLQPQFFALLAFRFPKAGLQPPRNRWMNAIANGQYLLFRRQAYREIGGHGAVRGEVVEDMRLAQILTREGIRLLVREDPGLETRMYRSLAGLVEGWSKSVATGALQAFPGLLQPVILPLSFVIGLVLWLLPPLVLGWVIVNGIPGLPLLVAAGATGFGVLFWGAVGWFMGTSFFYGLLYPLASAVTAFIFLRSWIRGSRVEWKGRTYRVPGEIRRGLVNSGTEKGPSNPPVMDWGADIERWES